MADPSTPTWALDDDEPTPEEHTAALVQALRSRGQQAQPALEDFARQRQLGNLGTLIGGPLQGIGQSLLSDARNQEQLASTAAYRQALVDNTRTRNESQDRFRKTLEGVKTQDQQDQENHVGKYAQADQTVTTDDGVFRVNKFDPNDKTKIGNAPRKLTRGGGGAPAAPVTLETAAPWEIAAAKDYERTHTLPPLGKDVASKKRILDLHAQLFGNGGSAGSAADFGTDKASLGHAKSQLDAVNGFIGTFDKNIGMLEEAAKGLKSSNSPFLNKGLRWYQENVEGDPALTAFRNALTTVNSEGAKINSGSTGQGGTPISIIAEMEHNLGPNATPAQVVAALKVLRRDSENRRSALSGNVGSIQKRMGISHATDGNSEAVPAGSAPTPALQPGEVLMRDPKGVPHAVPQAQVKAALEHKWTQG